MSMMVSPYAFAAAGGGPDPYFSNVILLMGFNGADGSTSFVDESSYGRTVSAFGNAQIDTAQSKFGVSSLLLDGSGDYLTLPDSNDWDFGSGDWTVELFVRLNTTGNMAFLGQANAATGWQFMRESNTLRFNAYAGGQYQAYETGGTWTGPTGQWFHIAADRSGNTWRVYRDGVRVFSGTRSNAISNSTDVMKIGRGFSSDFNGWMDEIRITKGVARYATDSGFTPPSAAFPRS